MISREQLEVKRQRLKEELELFELQDSVNRLEERVKKERSHRREPKFLRAIKNYLREVVERQRDNEKNATQVFK